MDILPHIAGKLPAKTDEQKAACIATLEPVIAWLAQRGAAPGILSAALIELSIKVRQDAAGRAALPPGRPEKGD